MSTSRALSQVILCLQKHKASSTNQQKLYLAIPNLSCRVDSTLSWWLWVITLNVVNNPNYEKGRERQYDEWLGENELKFTTYWFVLLELNGKWEQAVIHSHLPSYAYHVS